jgi:hypothetical protein
MSETISHPRRVLHLVIDDFSAGELAGLVESSPEIIEVTEILRLTEANARGALDLIFASDTVAVWGKTE